MFSPQPPQHPACGSARGASAGFERMSMMDTSKAGDDTGRHVRFTWAGAVRPLRSARLTLCRQFRPSPCPTHYGGRSATVPSADFCSITPGVATERAARVVTGSGGDCAAFAQTLSPAPIMQFLFVGSHHCARASFRHALAASPLPSASGYVSITGTPTGDSHPIRSCPCRAYTSACRGVGRPIRCRGNPSLKPVDYPACQS